MFLRLILVIAGSYALGCFLAAYYVTLWRHGVDIRASGSGNAGARNMARVYGLFDAALTLVLDAAKGAVVVAAGLYFVGAEWAAVAALLAAIVGHIWPAQLSFRGGKGAATGLGGILVLDPIAALALLGVGVVLLLVTRDFFRSGLAVIALAEPMLAILGHDSATLMLTAITAFVCLIANHPVIDGPRQPRATAEITPPP